MVESIDQHKVPQMAAMQDNTSNMRYMVEVPALVRALAIEVCCMLADVLAASTVAKITDESV